MATFPIPGYNKPIQPHWGSNRGGTDLFADEGTPVVSASPGTVVYSGYDPIGGNFAQIRDNVSGLTYYYAHLKELAVRSGQTLLPGERIGSVGSTGNAAGTGPHLHLGIGKTIQAGAGPSGGTGTGFDAVAFLTSLLGGGSGSPANTPAPGMPEPGSPAGPATAPAPASVIPARDTSSVSTGNFITDAIASLSQAISNIPNAILSPFEPLITALSYVDDEVFWLRLFLILLGAILFIVGVIMFGLSFVKGETVIKAAKAAAL